MPEGHRPKKRKAGWFVEVEASIKAEFKAYYPTRAAMKKVTLQAIERAVQYARDHNLPRHDKEKSVED